jgi:flagellar hook-basal body complex protein FliE
MSVGPVASVLMVPEGSVGSDGPGALGRVVETGTSVASSVSEGFEGAFLRATLDASRMEKVAVAKSEDLAQGLSDDLHGTMIAVKEAEISMRLVGSIRNKLLDAFHELWRTNV